MKYLIPQLFNSENKVISFILILIFTVVLFMLVAPPINIIKESYSPDDIIPYDIIAERDILVRDQEASDLKTKELLSTLDLIFDYQPLAYQKTNANIKENLKLLREQFIQDEEKKKKNVATIELLKLNLFELELDKNKLLKNIQTTEKYIKSLEVKKQKDSFEINQAKEKLKRLQLELKNTQLAVDKAIEIQNSAIEKEENFKQSLIEQQNKNIQAFYKNIGLENFSDDNIIFEKALYLQPLDELFRNVTQNFDNQPIAYQKDISSLAKENKKARLNNLSNQEQILIEATESIITVENVKKTIQQNLVLLITNEELEKYAKIIETMFIQLVDSNIFLNRKEFEKQKEAIINNTGHVYVSYKKGELILQRGTKANQNQINVINGYFAEINKVKQIPKLIGIFLIVIVALLLSFLILKEKYKSFQARKYTLMLLCSLVFTLLLINVWTEIAYNIVLSYSLIPTHALLIGMPIIIAPMILRILTHFHVSLHSSILISFFVGIMQEFDFMFFAFALVTSITATLPLKKTDRLAFLRHGIKVSFVAICFVCVMVLLGDVPLDNNLIFFFSNGFFCGIIASIFVLFLMPIFEYIFDITTEIKLLELSNMNHPVLKRLLRVAPGTYQHSIMVGTIAEAGALEIGANSLLCRVASYYHDIGKQSNPEFFIENLSSSEVSIHSKLKNPQQSASIIINHVSEGVKIAKENNLGTTIINIIREHHGQSLVKYFYNIALKEKNNFGDNTFVRKVYETDFRYLGPKPQTIEAAIVMLADSSEAATRSMSKQDMNQIKQTVNNIFDEYFTSGQLDESGMTFTQFKILKKLFSQIIASVYHQRIDYNPTYA